MGDFITKFEQFAPKKLAMDGDPIGLAIGSAEQVIDKMMVTLDVRPETVQEAIDQHVQFIFSHHPPIFRSVKTLTTEDPQTRMYRKLIQHNISVYSAHTNFDVAIGGMNDLLSDLLELEDTEILAETYAEKYKKLAIFTPLNDSEKMRKALHRVGVGEIGEYKNVSYSLKGLGRFTPTEKADPAIGKSNQPEQIEEEKIEFLLPQSLTELAIQTIKEVHPYEEPVFDLYSIDHYQKHFGLGRIGNLKNPVSFEKFVDNLQQVFQVEGVRIVNYEPTRQIQRIAILGGDGGKFYQKAVEKNADVFITGDVYYHTAHDMQAANLSVIDPGHHIESLAKAPLTEKFQQWAMEEKWELEVISSQLNTDPFKFILKK